MNNQNTTLYTFTPSSSTCANQATMTIEVNSAPVITSPTTVSCSGAAVVLTSSLTSGVQWYKTGVLISGATSATYSATTAGIYTVIPTACSSLVSNGITVTTGSNPGTPIASVQSGTLLLCGTGAQVVLASNIAPSTSATLQWYKDGTAIAGATSTTYAATTDGSYLVRRIAVANGCYSTSNAQVAVSGVQPLFSITGSSTPICSGSSVTLTASGTGVDTYTWSNSSTGSSITVSPTSTTTYTLTGTNTSGCSATATTTVDVISTPVVTAPSTVICSGAEVVLTSSLTSGVQWYKTGVLISGATSATYSATTAGIYTVKPTACSSLVSNGITVTTGSNPGTPTASVQSGTLLLCGTGAQVVLASNISPSTSATLQWYKDGTAIAGATSTTYAATTGGSYLVRRINVANICYSTSNAQVAVSGGSLPPAPTANVQSGDLLLCGTGAQVTLQSTVAPSASSTLQWFKNGISISGATAQTYVANSAGAYTVKRVYVSSGCASSSNSVSVVQGGSLPSAPSISSPTSVICSGAGTITMTSNQAPSATVSLQWYKNGVLVSGATAQTYAAVSVGSYTVKKLSTTGGCASLPSNAIGVSVGVTPSTIPAISIQTGTLPLCTGSAVVLQTAAIPTSTQTLQWYKSGVALSGATGTSYTALVGGSYTVKLVETGGCATTSSGFAVSQQTPPSATVVTVHSGSLLLCNGSAVTLKSSSLPTATVGIRWYKDGVQISGATGQFYTATTAGSYTARRITLSSGCISNASTPRVVTSCNPIVVNDNNEEQEDATSKLNEELTWDAAVSRNPYDQYVTIRLNTASDSDVELTMVDAMGKVVSTDNASMKELGSLHIGEGLTPGMYLIQVRQDENIKTIRVIKQ
jgi:hypothetical protein